MVQVLLIFFFFLKNNIDNRVFIANTSNLFMGGRHSGIGSAMVQLQGIVHHEMKETSTHSHS